MIAIRVVRPGVAGRGSGERSNSRQDGLNAVTSAPAERGLRYGFAGVEVKNDSASWVPTTKFESCWNGTPGQPVVSPSGGVAMGSQNGKVLPVSCGSVSLVPWPWTS